MVEFLRYPTTLIGCLENELAVPCVPLALTLDNCKREGIVRLLCRPWNILSPKHCWPVVFVLEASQKIFLGMPKTLQSELFETKTGEEKFESQTTANGEKL